MPKRRRGLSQACPTLVPVPLSRSLSKSVSIGPGGGSNLPLSELAALGRVSKS
jgi:hypothetical protein